jgi:hypothetical protein
MPLIWTTGSVELGAGGEEVETGLGQLGPAFARQSFVEFDPHCVQVTHVGRCVFTLGVGKFWATPIGRLLLLGDVLSEHFLDQILEPVTVGIGADQARRGLGAIDRPRHDPQIGLHDRKVEAGEMIELEPGRIGQDRLEVRRLVAAAGGESDEMLVAAAVGDLDDAQPVAIGEKPHRLGVDGDRAGGEHALGQVFFVEMDGHGLRHKRNE